MSKSTTQMIRTEKAKLPRKGKRRTAKRKTAKRRTALYMAAVEAARGVTNTLLMAACDKAEPKNGEPEQPETTEEGCIDRLLSAEQVARRTGMPRPTIYRYVDNQWFPEPVLFEPGVLAWFESDITQWISDGGLDAPWIVGACERCRVHASLAEAP